MNYYLPYLSQTVVEDVVRELGYEPAPNKNGYVRPLYHYKSHPRYHLHITFHELQQFILVQLHFDKFMHKNSGGEAADYMSDGVKHELKKIEKALIWRLLNIARENGMSLYGTVNIPRIDPYAALPKDILKKNDIIEEPATN